MKSFIVEMLNAVFILSLNNGSSVVVEHTSIMVLFVGMALQVEASVIMVMVIPPAWFLLNCVMPSGPFASMVLSGLEVLRVDNHLVVAELMSVREFSIMLILYRVLMSVFFFKGTAQVLLELFLLGDVSFMRLQVRQRLVQLRHEDLVIGLAKVGVIVPAKLVVTVDHVADSAHHPLDSVHGADSVGITIHDSQRCLADMLNRNISSGAVLLALEV